MVSSTGMFHWSAKTVLAVALLVVAAELTVGQVRSSEPSDYDVRSYGAVGDGETVDTAAIQRAIDACAEAGGGTVYLRRGTFLSGTILLKGNVTLYLESGVTLLGSRDIEHYPDITPKIPYLYMHRFTKYLIYAECAENIGIEGRGVIDGQGKFFDNPHGDGLRPYILRFSECKNVRVTGVTFRDSARWLSHYLACEDVVIDGVRIENRRRRENRDGIDIDSCRRVQIANCHVNAGDDAIVLKATAHRKCRDVTVTNCVLSSMASAFKLGTESNGGFEDITCSNCTIYDTTGSGIGVMMVDGARLARVNVSNITMRDVAVPIFVRLGNRARPLPDEEKPGVGSLQDVVISNVQGTASGPVGCSVTGLDGHPAENITLENIRLRFVGGGTTDDARRDPAEKESAYPKGSMFGTLPAYGFYCRHVKNLRLHNLDLEFDDADQRPAIVCNDVTGLDVFSVTAKASSEAESVLRLMNCDGGLIHGCRPTAATHVWLRVEGAKSRDIALAANDLRKAERPVVAVDDVLENAIVGAKPERVAEMR